MFIGLRKDKIEYCANRNSTLTCYTYWVILCLLQYRIAVLHSAVRALGGFQVGENRIVGTSPPTRWFIEMWSTRGTIQIIRMGFLRLFLSLDYSIPLRLEWPSEHQFVLMLMLLLMTNLFCRALFVGLDCWLIFCSSKGSVLQLWLFMRFRFRRNPIQDISASLPCVRYIVLWLINWAEEMDLFDLWQQIDRFVEEHSTCLKLSEDNLLEFTPA